MRLGGFPCTQIAATIVCTSPCSEACRCCGGGASTCAGGRDRLAGPVAYGLSLNIARARRVHRRPVALLCCVSAADPKSAQGPAGRPA